MSVVVVLTVVGMAVDVETEVEVSNFYKVEVINNVKDMTITSGGNSSLRS